MNFTRQTTGEEGLALLARIKSARPDLPVILITAWGSIALAVAAISMASTAPRAAVTLSGDYSDDGSVLKLGITYPLPMKKIAEFAQSVERCLVIEEGDPYLVDAIRAAGLSVEGKDDMYRFGELNVERVRRILTQVGFVDVAVAPHTQELTIGAGADLEEKSQGGASGV